MLGRERWRFCHGRDANQMMVVKNCVKKNCPEPARGCQRLVAIFNSTKASENQKEKGEKKREKSISVTGMDPAPIPIEPRGNSGITNWSYRLGGGEEKKK